MNLARLTDKGINAFAEYLNRARTGEPNIPPVELLTDPEFSNALSGNVTVDPDLKFTNRFHCASYLHEVLAGLQDDVTQDVGLWSWLSLLYFDQICPPRTGGARTVREQARYIPVPQNFQKYHRHLLSGPYLAFKSHGDNPERAKVALTGALHTPGEVAEYLLAGQERMTNRAVLDAATRLYLDPKKSKLKRGSGGKGPGSVRRFVDLLNQLDLTYDLYGLTGDELLQLLPQEFDQFSDAVRYP